MKRHNSTSHVRTIFHGSFAAAVLLVATSCFDSGSSIPDPTPKTYAVYVGNEFDTGGVSTGYMKWDDSPYFAGEDSATASFDIGLSMRPESDGTTGYADSVDWIVISMNLLSERYARTGDDAYSAPGEVWIDAIENVQTGGYVGVFPNGNTAGWTVLSYQIYSVLDTVTGEIAPVQSIENILGPPDGKYSLLATYETAFVAIGSFTGVPNTGPLMSDEPGPDIRIYARQVPASAGARAALPSAGGVKLSKVVAPGR